MQAQPHRAPLALRGIALLEAAKGILAIAAVCGIISLRHTDLHTAVDAFLIRHGVDPARPYMRLFVESVAEATDHHAGELVTIGLMYAAIRFIEAYGLWQGKHWAEWFAVISASIYLPLEFRHFARHASALSAAIILVNLLIVVYLAWLLTRARKAKHRTSLPPFPENEQS